MIAQISPFFIGAKVAYADTSSVKVPTSTHLPNNWDVNSVANVQVSSDALYATENDGSEQGYSGFDFSEIPAGSTVNGIEVHTSAGRDGGLTNACQLGVAVSGDGGATYSTYKTRALTNTITSQTLGSSSDLWGETWALNNLNETDFVVKIDDVDPGGDCINDTMIFVDFIGVQVHYTAPEPSTFTLTVKKTVINDDSGNKSANDFGIGLEGFSNFSFSVPNDISGTNVYQSSGVYSVRAQAYLLSEDDTEGYAEGDWECSGTDNKSVNGLSVSLQPSANEEVVCEITNNDSVDNTTNTAITPPESPVCTENGVLWKVVPDLSMLASNNSLRVANALINSSRFSIDTGLTFGPGTVDITKYVSWDGYSERVNAVQPEEQWVVQFWNGGSVVATTGFTEDLTDGVVSDTKMGSLGQVILENGADKVLVVHKAALQDVVGGANSVVPAALCLSHTPPEEKIKIRVEKFEDTNADGEAPNYNDENKEPRATLPFEFTLYKDDVKVESNSTNTNGSLAFADQQGAGLYTVCETENAGWFNTYSYPGSPVDDPEDLGRVCVEKELKPGDQWTFVFANTRYFDIWVEKYEDTDKDGEAPNLEGEPRATEQFDFTLYDENSNMVSSGQTNESNNGKIQIGDDLTPGKYTVCEENNPKWLNTFAGPGDIVSDPDNKNRVCVSREFVSGENWTFVFGNWKKPPAKVIATKVVCNNESLLPNWSNGGPSITALTAIDWVTQNEGCKLSEGWNFQYAFNNQSNPGDNIEDGGAGWDTFGPTDANGQTSVEFDKLSDINRIWIREMLPNGYLGYTYNEENQQNTNNVSAEMYCHTDVLNYDNYDYITDLAYDENYYCVAWNVELAQIRAIKYNDLNRNGIRDGGEPRLDGWEMTLYDNAGNVITSGLTGEDGDGKVVFNGLLPGKYKVCETLQDGWAFSEPTDKTGCRYVTLSPGENAVARFGNAESVPIVCVTKNTIGGDGLFKFQLFNNQQLYAGFGLSDVSQNDKYCNVDFSDGYNSGYGLEEGQVKVVEEYIEGWDNTQANCEYYDEKEGWIGVGTEFMAYGGVEYLCEFVNVKRGEVVVTKFHDLNKNGYWDEDEDSLPGWEILLNEESVITDENGQAIFNNVQDGWFTFDEVMQPDWEQTGAYCDEEIERELKFNILQETDEVFDGYYLSPGETKYCYIGNFERHIQTSVEAVCENNFPYLRWNVSANFTPTQFIIEWFTESGNDANDPAGTLVQTDTLSPGDAGVSFDGTTYSGTLLWPGANDDPANEDWPGWTEVNGIWEEDVSDFGGNLRPSANVSITVNPTVDTPSAYPDANEDCNPSNPAVLSATTTTLASTGETLYVDFLVALLLFGSVAGLYKISQKETE